MITLKKTRSGFQEVVLIWFVVSLMTASASAAPDYLVSGGAGFKLESARGAGDTSFRPVLSYDQEKAFARDSFIVSLINKSLFPDVSDPESRLNHLLLRTELTGSELESINFSNASGWNMSLTQERARRAAAKRQTYKIMSKMFTLIKPVERLQKALEPYTRLIELYRDEDGNVSSNYLGQTSGNSTGSVRMFVLNFGVSSFHNVNVMANIQDQFTVSLLDGDRLITQYLIPESNGAIGLETNGRSELLFRYSTDF